MDRNVFDVTLGRLREAGQMGWLSVTTTPKGKANWVYEQFGSNRPNCELIRCRTSENPFLPSEFHENLRQQYTSRLALQELEGAFIDQESGLFHRRWFEIVTVLPKIVSWVRSWDLAGTPKNEKE